MKFVCRFVKCNVLHIDYCYRLCECRCVCVRVRMFVRVHVAVCVCLCVRLGAHVHVATFPGITATDALIQLTAQQWRALERFASEKSAFTKYHKIGILY